MVTDGSWFRTTSSLTGQSGITRSLATLRRGSTEDGETSKGLWMLLPRLRRLRKALLVPLALLVLVSAIQLGPLATLAAAQHVVDKECEPLGATREWVTGTGINIIDVCIQVPHITDIHGTHYKWIWDFLRFKPADGDKRVRASRSSTSPPYWMHIQGIFGGGAGGGAAGGRIWITNPDGSRLHRRIAVRVLMEVSSSPTGGWYNCAGRDTGWREPPGPESEHHAFLNNYTQPDCGVGYYRTQVAGRFWSISLNQWITSQWHYTPAVWVDGPPCCVAATEPTSKRVPPVTGNP